MNDISSKLSFPTLPKAQWTRDLRATISIWRRFSTYEVFEGVSPRMKFLEWRNTFKTSYVEKRLQILIVAACGFSRATFKISHCSRNRASKLPPWYPAKVVRITTQVLQGGDEVLQTQRVGGNGGEAEHVVGVEGHGGERDRWSVGALRTTPGVPRLGKKDLGIMGKGPGAVRNFFFKEKWKLVLLCILSLKILFLLQNNQHPWTYFLLSVWTTRINKFKTVSNKLTNIQISQSTRSSKDE